MEKLGSDPLPRGLSSLWSAQRKERLCGNPLMNQLPIDYQQAIALKLRGRKY
jgi:hypothetical protein